MSAPDTWNLWAKIRAWPWDEKERPRPRAPHPEPELPGRIGDWLTEYEITTYPQAPEGWTLVQYEAIGHGIHSGNGRPTSKVRSLVLAYFHKTTARGATAILHFKPGAKKDGSGSWRFETGYRWDICTEIDCDHDEPHPRRPPLSDASSDEIQALLSNTNPERTETT